MSKTAEKRITRVEMFIAMRDYLEGGDTEVAPEEMVAFLDRELELIAGRKERAAARKPVTEPKVHELDDRDFAVLDVIKNAGDLIAGADIVTALEGKVEDITLGKVRQSIKYLANAGKVQRVDVLVPGEDGKSLKRVVYKIAD